MTTTPPMSVRDARKLIASFGSFRSSRRPCRQFTSPANVSVQIAKNDSDTPITIIVQELAPTATRFSPNRDSASNAVLRVPNVNVGAGGTSFVLAPSAELWVRSLAAPGIYRVTEVRV